MLLKSDSNSLLINILIIAFLAMLAMLYSFFNGIPIGNDLSQHYQFATTIHQSIISGEIYPSFASNAGNGFGDYGIRFYPPLAYYLLSINYIILSDWYIASLFSFFLIFFIGGIGVFLFAKEEFSEQQAILATVIYTFAPYHINQIYNNFLFAEFASTAVIPFCFLFLYRLLKKPCGINVVSFSISYALLILTHLPVTIICSVVFVIFTLIFLEKKTFFAVIPKVILSIMMALALSSFYWIKVVLEMSWIKHSLPVYFSTTWDYKSNFLLTPQSFLNFQNDDLSLWFANLMLIAIMLLAIPSIYLILKDKFQTSKFMLASFIVFIFSVFMTTPISKFIWDNLTFLQKVQFPWRWMGIVSLFGAIFCSFGLIKTLEKLKLKPNMLLQIGLSFVIFIFVFTSSFVMKSASFSGYTEFNNQISQLLEKSVSFDCWWTIWAKNINFNRSEKVTVQNRATTIEKWEAKDRFFSIESGNSGNAKVSTIYYPYWKAEINGQSKEVLPDEQGLISFEVSESKSDVRLFFKEPNSIQIARFISIFCWLATILFLFISYKNFYLKPSKQTI